MITLRKKILEYQVLKPRYASLSFFAVTVTKKKSVILKAIKELFSREKLSDISKW